MAALMMRAMTFAAAAKRQTAAGGPPTDIFAAMGLRRQAAAAQVPATPPAVDANAPAKRRTLLGLQSGG